MFEARRAGLHAVLAALLPLAGCQSQPRYDVFVPPYAEKGCWARLYQQPGFAGAMRQLEGPVFAESVGASPVIVPDLEKIPPQPLFGQVRSLELGPHARLEGYAEPLFRKPQLALAPGSRVADIAFGERLGSFTLRCAA